MHSIDLKLNLEIVLLEGLERPGESISNILILLVKVFIFNSQSVDSILFDRLKLYVKHHRIVERYVLGRNPKWVASRDGDKWEWNCCVRDRMMVKDNSKRRQEGVELLCER
jgi:hypothetical protein